MSFHPFEPPFAFPNLPHTGGRIGPAPEDFRVDEVLAFEPEGVGEHVFLHIEKRDLSTPQAVKILAETLGLHPRDLGYAGMKDKHAITRQWIQRAHLRRNSPPPPTHDCGCSKPRATLESCARDNNAATAFKSRS